MADVYQGDELLALSLVDPDNRRAVDWERRRALLDALRAGAEPSDETRKLWLIVRALELRTRRAEAFDGGYEPIDAGGNVCAFARGDAVVAAAAVRGDGAGAAVPLPPGRWRCVLHGAEVEGEAPLDAHGLALLERA
jgi:(1->4)-alpha-D-glucan 1-alpha-D-glucosylmutase